MKGYWYYAAITTGAAILFVITRAEWLPLLIILWLIWLKTRKGLPTLPFIISIISFCFFIFYIPEVEEGVEKEDFQHQSSPLTGSINGSVVITEDYMQFQLDGSQSESNVNFLVMYFFDQSPRSQALFVKNNELLHGATCTIYTSHESIEKPPSSTNPAQFNYQQFLLQKDIHYQIIMEDVDQLHCTNPKPLSHIYLLRHQLIDYVKGRWSDETVTWLTSIVFGDDSMMDEPTEELFQRWSLSHIIAISGSNITLIITIVFLLLVKGNIVTKERAQTLLILFLPFYGILAGGEPSVWRAVWMITILLIVQKFKKKFLYIDIFSFVFMSLILFDPYVIYELGFQFSFAVTFGILLSAKWITHSTSTLWNIVQISFVSQMAILPLQLHYFYIFQPLSILLNVIIIPYFTFLVIPFMYIATLFSFFPKHLLLILDNSFQWIHSIVVAFLVWVDTYLSFPLLMSGLSIAAVFAYYIFFFRFMYELELKRMKMAFLSGVLFCLPVIIGALKPYVSDEGIVTMFDIGQGDAILIETPYRQDTILLDAGSTFDFESMEANRGVYKQILRPYFYSRGITHLDAIILTHEDLDHIGSLEYILEEVTVDTILVSSFFDDQIINDIQSLFPKQIIKRIEAGQIIKADFTNFYVLSPTSDHQTVNDNSLVMYADLGGKWLFTGDIGSGVEKSLLNNHPEMNIDILKIAHHGSDTSSDSEFIEKIDPDFGLISVGRNNRYGHPAVEVIETMESKSIDILRTDMHGAIQYFFSNNQGTFLIHLP
ncbi:late competence protein (DNA binding and uptake) [Oceanobacillus iheyensis HTE831]|uniref:Late competence protein (DNA binding and uptake) n=1 Tax=Oceanobacillus iheyensis (strain DSM 14371 / CIP 107618 / JCM 11309 / KCTC 3954 / HTE831) TaxID=221109 RepID=Q8EPV7_OCEIH|nr:DNA internalization-related competence protein ComEC/Rec2 [Oceanobacillus iheyensis]BAC13935.1 late competence protein (DNA binding and uptake) [Oceanobacillus iheyensis HTE831]